VKLNFIIAYHFGATVPSLQTVALPASFQPSSLRRRHDATPRHTGTIPARSTKDAKSAIISYRAYAIWWVYSASSIFIEKMFLHFADDYLIYDLIMRYFDDSSFAEAAPISFMWFTACQWPSATPRDERSDEENA
jgi:hypothetical protein